MVRRAPHVLVVGWRGDNGNDGMELGGGGAEKRDWRERLRPEVGSSDGGQTVTSVAGLALVSMVGLIVDQQWLTVIMIAMMAAAMVGLLSCWWMRRGGGRMCGIIMVGLSAMLAAVFLGIPGGGSAGRHWQHRPPEGLLYGQGWQDRPPGMHVVTTSETFKPAMGHVGFVGDTAIRVGWDTFCEPEGAVRRSVVDSTWEVLDTQGLAVTGVGDGMLGARVRVPLKLRYNAEPVMVDARIAEDEMMPADCDFLCDTGMQRQMGLRIDSGMERLELRTQGISIVMEELWVLKARMEGKPISVLDLCASASAAYAVFRDMGWNISEWHAVEPNGIASKVAEFAYAGKVKLVSKRVESFNCTRWYDVVLAGPPCQPWSRLNASAKGFGDPRSEVFSDCCRVINQARAVNPVVKFMLENVVMHSQPIQDAQVQEVMIGQGFEEFNVISVGGQSSRMRRVAQNVVESVHQLEQREPLDPNVSLNCLGARCEQRTTGCVVASGTHSKARIMVQDIHTGQQRSASLDEMEALMGHVVGTSNAGGRVEMGYEDRAGLIGNGFHYEMLRAIFSEMAPKEREVKVVKFMPMAGADGDYTTQHERELTKLSRRSFVLS
jgi:site-specific DNA-cytosine methylase